MVFQRQWAFQLTRLWLPFCIYALYEFVPAQELIVWTVTIDSLTIKRQQGLDVRNVAIFSSGRNDFCVWAGVRHRRITGGQLRYVHLCKPQRNIKVEGQGA